jgi:hypothetical protein
MRRTAIAAVWLIGTTVPLLAAAVFVFGCCVLPFHRTIHAAMPFCHAAIGVITGHAGPKDAQQPLPARAKQEPASRIATTVPRSAQVAAQPPLWRAAAAMDAAAYRTFIAHGALRCDQDVGLHLLAGTLLI